MRDGSSTSPARWARAREQPLLWILFALSPCAFLIFIPPELDLVLANVGRVGLGALLSLVAWWAYTGFSGYEHFIGWRIVMRPGAKPKRARLMWSVLGVAVVGAAAMLLGFRNAPLAVLVAVCTLVAMGLVLLRYFAVSAALSIVGIAIGVAALIVVQSVATGFQHEFERRVFGVYSHINVTRPYGISEYRRFESYLRTVDGVDGASPFVYYAMAIAPVVEPGTSVDEVPRATALVKGIEPSTADQVIDVESHLASGMEDPVPLSELTSDLALQPMPDRDDDRLPGVIANTPDPRGEAWYPEAMARWRTLPSDQKFGRRRAKIDDDEWPEDFAVENNTVADEELPTMFVGYALARQLELDIGDAVMLVDPGASFDHTQAPEFRRYRIAGIFRAGFQEYDDHLVYIHIKELQYFKYRGKDIVSGVDLRLEDPYEAPAVESVLRTTIGADEYTILEWQKLNANLFQSIQTQKTILTIILSLVGTVAGFNVLAALWTMVMRRNAEIAIIMSMGASEGGVARFFQFSGMMLGAAGSIAGVLYGLVLCGLVELYGYTLDPEVYFIEELPVELSLVQIGVVVALTMGISFVATIPPSLRAAQLRPVEGLRYE